jgi:peptidoglycan hydrolase CwlO-like protein
MLHTSFIDRDAIMGGHHRETASSTASKLYRRIGLPVLNAMVIKDGCAGGNNYITVRSLLLNALVENANLESVHADAWCMTRQNFKKLLAQCTPSASAQASIDKRGGALSHANTEQEAIDRDLATNTAQLDLLETSITSVMDCDPANPEDFTRDMLKAKELNTSCRSKDRETMVIQANLVELKGKIATLTGSIVSQARDMQASKDATAAPTPSRPPTLNREETNEASYATLSAAYQARIDPEF